MITGANQGGKSTFLRSVGLAQLMMQCRHVRRRASRFARQRLRRPLHALQAGGRRHDGKGEAGRGAGRMSDIAGHITPGCLLLCNESFASTNEREGSEIARQIIRALLESRHQGLLRHPPVRPRARLPRRGTRQRRCSCGPSGETTGGGPSGCSWASPCRPATARTSTGRSSARVAGRGSPKRQWRLAMRLAITAGTAALMASTPVRAFVPSGCRRPSVMEEPLNVPAMIREAAR